MGRIRPTSVKRATEKILKLFPNIFTANYAENKKIVPDYAEVKSKKILNVLAGSITRAIVMGKKEHNPRVMRDQFRLPDTTKPRLPRNPRKKRE